MYWSGEMGWLENIFPLLLSLEMVSSPIPGFDFLAADERGLARMK
jgi:hypothetical protein